LVQLGEIGGYEPGQALGTVADVRVVADGNVVVLDYQAQEVRVFAPTGRLLRTVAGRGEGPGELKRAYSLAESADGTFWVADGGTGRYSRFSTDGSLLHEFRADVVGGLFAVGGTAVGRDGIIRDPVQVASPNGARLLGIVQVAQDDGGIVDTTVVALERYEPAVATVVRGGITARSYPPFTPETRFAIAPDGNVWVGSAHVYELSLVTPDGDTVAVLRRETPSVPLASSDSELVSAWVSASSKVERSEAVPRVYPFFDALSVDARMNLWVWRQLSESTYGADVYSADGRFIESVATPALARSSPARPSVHEDLVVLLTVDSLDVATIEVMRRRPQ
jgi:sugar lactone lactonase YvrE